MLAANVGLPVILLGIVVLVAVVYGLGLVFGRGARRGSAGTPPGDPVQTTCRSGMRGRHK